MLSRFLLVTSRIFPVLAVTALGFSLAQAQENRIWDNVSGSWETAGNWTPDGTPSSADSVTIAQINSLISISTGAVYETLNFSGGRLTVAAGSTLTGAVTNLENLSASTTVETLNSSGTVSLGKTLVGQGSFVTVLTGTMDFTDLTVKGRGFLDIYETANASATSLVVDGGNLTVRGVMNTYGLNVGGNAAGFSIVVQGGTWNANPSNSIVNLGLSEGGRFILSSGSTMNVNNGSGFIHLGENINGTATMDSTIRLGGLGNLSAGAINAAGIVGYSNRGVIQFEHNSSSYEFSTALSGNLKVKQMFGTTILDGTHTYTGTTEITGGTLLLQGTINNSAIAVNGGIFAGTGSASATTLNSGGIAAGDGVGTLTLASLLWNAGTLNFQLGEDDAESDHLHVINALVKGSGGTFLFHFTDAESLAAEGDTFTLVDFADQSGFNEEDFSYDYSGAHGNFEGTFNLDGESLKFTVTAVPEPSVWILLGFGGIVLVGSSRWRSAAAR